MILVAAAKPSRIMAECKHSAEPAKHIVYSCMMARNIIM